MFTVEHAAIAEPLHKLCLDELVVGPQQRLDILEFLTAREVGRWAASSRAAASDIAGVYGEVLWHHVYSNTCRLRGPASKAVRELVARPCADAAVGCRVAVEHYPAGADACRLSTGVVKEFDVRRNAYLVHYDEPPPGMEEHEVWEPEARSAHNDAALLSNPSLASRSRFHFLNVSCDAEVDSGKENTGGSLARSGDKLLRFSTWQEELKNTVSHTPWRQRFILQDHVDEVLFVTFSPCGTLMASSSKDRRTIVYKVDSRNSPQHLVTLLHESTSLRADFWPDAPHKYIIVSTGGPMEEPFAEIWDIQQGTLVFQEYSYPFDNYARVVRWPDAREGDMSSSALLAGAKTERFLTPQMQVMNLWRLQEPTAPGQEFSTGVEMQLLLRVQTQNYYHCPSPAPPGKSEGQVAMLLGNCNLQCDILALFRLPARCYSAATVHVPPKLHEMPTRAILSVRWTQDGSLLLLNTRPRIQGSDVRQQAPPLSTMIELLVVDPETLDTVGLFGGHFAFTTAEAPFILHTDAWADNDIIASGGEDWCVHIWHRRHNRQLQRLEGHKQAVNAVSWSQRHRMLASASDDYTVILWGNGCPDHCLEEDKSDSDNEAPEDKFAEMEKEVSLNVQPEAFQL